MSHPPEASLGVTSRGILRLPLLAALLGCKPRAVRRFDTVAPGAYAGIVGWGRRPTTRRAVALAEKHALPFLSLEDGFLRSFGTGEFFPPLSLVVDDKGVYYDCRSPSALETLLNTAPDLAEGADTAGRARALILERRLSKYNHAPALASGALRDTDVARVLVIDQTAGDMSVALGGAEAATFVSMLHAARAENPAATIYVKTHPEVTSGRKRGYLTDVENDVRTVVLREAVSPMSLIEQMDRVYVVTSTMGFEALLMGKPVSVFGMPWYAGWGATDDRQRCVRRTRRRSVDELFAAAYCRYPRYLDPVTHQRGTIFDVIDWLTRQREMATRFSGRMICVGFRRWRTVNVKPFLSLFPDQAFFVPNAVAAERIAPARGDCLIHWGRVPPAGVAELAARCGVRLLRMEDGFVRSVGLGSDLVRPLSLVLDERGIYFDPGQESDLEHLLNNRPFTDLDRLRAQGVRHFIARHGITKYNLEPRRLANWAHDGREVVLVPGQVESDASISFGCENVRTNLDLLLATRAAHPDAFIVYKPHPDVMSGNRKGGRDLRPYQAIADHVECQLSVVSCIEACSVVHTMTSLTGFDALLRGKRVVVYGRPFYAGWGLTEDRLAVPRRRRRLSLDELVAGALLHYPIYWDWQLKGYTTCEAVLWRLVERRDALEASNELENLRTGFTRRLWRKSEALLRAWLGKG